MWNRVALINVLHFMHTPFAPYNFPWIWLSCLCSCLHNLRVGVTLMLFIIRTPKCSSGFCSPSWEQPHQLWPNTFASRWRQCKLKVQLRVWVHYPKYNFDWELLKGSKSGSIICLFQSPFSVIVIWGMRMLNLPRCTKLWQLFHIARLEIKMEIYSNCLTLPASLKAML